MARRRGDGLLHHAREGSKYSLPAFGTSFALFVVTLPIERAKLKLSMFRWHIVGCPSTTLILALARAVVQTRLWPAGPQTEREWEDFEQL